MGTTRTESGVFEQRNRTSLCPIIYYPALVLTGIIAFAAGSNMFTQSTINQTLKLCNEKPLECKFKYDMVKYQETGQIPYKVEQTKK